MTEPGREEILTITKKAEERIGKPRRVGGQSSGAAPRFILFHAPISICSEKVRTILNAVGIPYIECSVNIRDPYNNNYSPEYVTLRKVAWLQLGEPNIAGEGNYEWTGSSSVASNGLDLCVVPTLVDLQPDIPKVVVDSEVICRYVVEADDNRLMPADNAGQIKKHMQLVDDMPHVALLYDGNPVEDNRPSYIKYASSAGLMHGNQIEALERRLAEEGTTWTDQFLKRVYAAKLNKTKAGQSKSKGDATSTASYLEKAMDKTRDILRAMEEDLSGSGSGWICNSKEPLLPDYIHGVNLHRLLWLGMEFLFDDFPKVKVYADKVFALKPLQDAVIFYPGMDPSKGTSHLFGKYKGHIAGFMHDRYVEIISTAAYMQVQMTQRT